MSVIEYSDLLFEISRRLDELNVLDRLLFMCRRNLAPGSADNIQNALSLFEKLEEQNDLGADRLEVIKRLLKSLKEWSLFGKVGQFESKRKKYNDLLEHIIHALDELDDLERLIAICKGKISEESEFQIQDVRSLIKELENQNNLYDRLDILKGILTEMEKSYLVKEVEEFEERRNQEDELERKKAQAVAAVSSVGNKLLGVLNIKTVFKVVAGGITVVSTLEVLSRWSTFDQLVTAVNSCVLPAGTSLVQLTDGCVCLTVRAETLSALTALWKLYQDGTLETRLYDFFVTDEVRERAGGEEVEVDVTIEEQEYEKACCELINEAQEAASGGDGKRIRRNSDSAMYFTLKEELPLLKLKHAETELEFHKERIAVIEREIAAQLSPEILERSSPEEKATFSKQHEKWKAREAGEMEERADESEISRLNKTKSMDPEKYAFVQKYLQDVQDTRSITTEASDSGLATHAAASELGNEEINESNKLRLKDLGNDVTEELIQRLGADEAAKELFCQFFGLKIQDRYPSVKHIEELFPDTTVGVLKDCFEALQLCDLAELLEKVRPRSLRPALPQEQVEKLRRRDNRPTKYHSNVAVLFVKHIAESDNVERDNEEKIEVFFKGLNSRNEVGIISLTISQETHEALRAMHQWEMEEELLKEQEKTIRRQLEKELPQQRERLERERQLRIPRGGSARIIKHEEATLGGKLNVCMEKAKKLREQIEREIKRVKELEKETGEAVSKAMDKLIHDQEKFTCVAVFVVSDDDLFEYYVEAVLDECVVKKLALLPDHAKLVVHPSWHERIYKVPETFHVMYPPHKWRTSSAFILMTEIFKTRWQTLDLISMMQEFKRTYQAKASPFRANEGHPFITIQDNLSTRPKFQKTEENNSVKATSDLPT